MKSLLPTPNSEEPGNVSGPTLGEGEYTGLIRQDRHLLRDRTFRPSPLGCWASSCAPNTACPDQAASVGFRLTIAASGACAQKVLAHALRRSWRTTEHQGTRVVVSIARLYQALLQFNPTFMSRTRAISGIRQLFNDPRDRSDVAASARSITVRSPRGSWHGYTVRSGTTRASSGIPASP
jgi:hypothetical protein